MGSVANVKIRPHLVKWGVDTAQIETIACVGAAALQNKYFYIYKALNAVKYYVWFNVNSAGVDPTPGGATAVPVAVATGASPSDVATALVTALNAISGTPFGTTTASNNVVSLTHAAIGYASQAHDSKTSTATGFAFVVTTQGISAADVGLVEGDIEFKPTEELQDIKAHEAGANVLGQLRTGYKAEVTLHFQETSPAQLRKILEQSGISMLPEGSGTTEVVGFGTGKQFGNTFAQATQLVLHPVYNALTDHSEDWTFWLAYPKLSSLKYSGEKVHTIPLTFSLFLDQSRKKGFEFGCYGDGTQTLT